MKTIKCMLAIAAFIVPLLCYAEPNEISKSDIEERFGLLSLSGEKLILIRSEKGARKLYTIGDRNPEITFPGDKIELPLGSSFEMYDRHSGLKFTPLPSPNGRKGFFIVYYSHTTSLGGGVKEKKGIIIFKESAGKDTIAPMIRLVKPDLAEAQKEIDNN